MSKVDARRAITVAVGIAVLTGLLTACERPVPELTVLANRVVTRVNPATYCFDSHSCRTGSASAKTVSATPGSTLLIDVPREVADGQWVVAAYTEDSGGKKTVIDGAGSTLLHDRHSVRLAVPSSTGAYALSIQSFDGTTPTGLWNVVVELGS